MMGKRDTNIYYISLTSQALVWTFALVSIKRKSLLLEFKCFLIEIRAAASDSVRYTSSSTFHDTICVVKSMTSSSIKDIGLLRP